MNIGFSMKKIESKRYKLKRSCLSIAILSTLPIYFSHATPYIDHPLNDPRSKMTIVNYDGSLNQHDDFIPQYNGKAINKNNVVIVDYSHNDQSKKIANIFGGYEASENASVQNTHVILKNGTIFKGVYGAYAKSALLSKAPQSEILAQGTVYIQNGNIEDKGKTESSQVSSYDPGVYGAYAYAHVSSNENASAKATAQGAVIIDGGSIKSEIYGASAFAYTLGDKNFAPAHAVATGSVIILGGEISNTIYGAYSMGDSISKSIGHIYIIGGTIKGDIIGGGVTSNNYSDPNNLSYIHGNVTIANNAEIYSDKIFGATLSKNISNTPNQQYDIFTGNTFNMKSQPLTVKNMGNFEYYNFTLNQYNQNSIENGEALLTITDSVRNDNTLLLESQDGVNTQTSSQNRSIVQITHIANTGIIETKQDIILIDASNAKFYYGNGAYDNEEETDIQIFLQTPENNSNEVYVGLAGTAKISYKTEDNKIIATIDEYNKYVIEDDVADRRVKPLAEGRLAGLMNIVGGADTLLDIMNTTQKPVGTWTPIAMIDAGKNRYNSGSHIKSKDYRIVLGTAYQATDALSIGATAEYGRSNYDTYNDHVRGKGHSFNCGISLFGQYQVDAGSGQAYTDFSLRFGNSKTKFHSDDIVISNDEIARYSSKAKYFGAHIGTGYRYPINNQYSLDGSARYLYTHMGSDSVIIDGDRVNFQSAKSSRIQLRGQLNYQASEFSTVHVAAMYEYEFDGKAKINVSGIGVDAPGVKGSSGILELGIKTQSFAKNRDLSLNLNLQGYGGKREGAKMNATLSYDL